MSANDKQIGGWVTYIPLTRGQIALVDEEDYPLLSKYKWCCVIPHNTHMYAVRSHEGNFTYMHRFILNAPPGVLVDHINGNTLDNRKSNLRFATKSQNAANTLKSNGKSKYKGVWFRERKKPWVAEIKKEGVKYHLGSFKTEIEAAMAYNKAAVNLFGSYAMENKIEI